MKTTQLILILFLILISSCRNETPDRSPKDLTIKTDTITKQKKTEIQPSGIDLKSEIIDTTSFEYLLTFCGEYGQIPNHLIRKYIDESILTSPNSTVFGHNKPYIRFNSIYIVYWSFGLLGVASAGQVYTYDINGEKIDSHQISYHSDGGFDTPITDCMFSTDINDTIIEITEEWSEVIDYELFRLIQNSTEIMSYEIDLPKKNRKISKYLIIKPNGSFRIVKNGNFTSDSTLYGFTSKRLITKKELGELHPVQLRIIRNEIFARHGYVFESRDLIKYFWDKEWYKPVDENDIIMSKLNWFEKTNSQLIMEREIGH